MHSYICLYIFLLFNLISSIFIFLSISFSYCSLHALKRIQKYTVYARIYFSSFCLFPRLFSVFLTDGAQLWFDPVYPTWWEFSAFVLFTLTEKWIIFVVHILSAPSARRWQHALMGISIVQWKPRLVSARTQWAGRCCRWAGTAESTDLSALNSVSRRCIREQHWGALCVVMTEDNGEKWKQHGLRSLTEIWTGRRCSAAFWFRHRCGNFLDYSEVTGIFVISVWRKPSRRPEITRTPAEAQPRLAACYKATSLFYSVESYSIS